MHLKVKTIVETAFSGGDAVLSSGGIWGLDGDIGLDSGSLRVPAFSVKQSILKGISGINLAPSARSSTRPPTFGR